MIDINDPQVFNKWRAEYHNMTDAEHLEFCDAAESKWPSQQNFTYENYQRLFNEVRMRTHVVEIGGWKGELAKKCLSHFPCIASWTNKDFCLAAISKTVPNVGDVYCAEWQDSPTWFRKPRNSEYNICIAAHAIEHLSDDHLLELLDWIKGIPTVIFEAPINYEENKWHNYYGTHILAMGWNRINAEMEVRGYSNECFNDHCFLYRIK